MDNNGRPLIQMQGVFKDYALGKENVSVLKDVSLTVNQGEYVAIMGHSGSGKSTLLNIIGCLDIATSGNYYLNGQNVFALTDNQLASIRNKEIGFVFQSFNLLPKIDLFANIELPLIYANVAKKKRKKKVNDILDKFGLTDRKNHKPNEISGGQKQRVAMARALVKKPSIILADEPTGNLDSHTTSEIMSLLDSLNKEGNTIILITHEHDVAARAGRLLNLVDGRFRT